MQIQQAQLQIYPSSKMEIVDMSVLVEIIAIANLHLAMEGGSQAPTAVL